ncbi:Efflux ABC transporter, permease protein [hydrothermal vent metagenome]|uniref:Efflux ABC transporter, permease protein n=1 Tax=hydrothermal vent metagenome TaxID=652676 RepID=A0A3B0W0K3_9ZZZZ
MIVTSAVYVIVLREFKRFFRQRGRLLTTLVRPLLWLFIVGTGLSRLVSPPGAGAGAAGSGEYMQFLLPGVIGMTILFSSIFSTMSVVWDREFGFLREMLVAPVSRLTIVTGKLLSGTALSLFQGMMLLIVAPLIGVKIGIGDIVAMVFLVSLVSFSLTSLGLFIAAHLKSLEGFNVIMNFLILPMFFLSGALYPVRHLPTPLRLATYINPLSYGIDAFKHVLLPGGGRLSPEFPLAFDIIFVSVFAAVMMALSARAFSRRG